jgi:hydroxymethylglutaryl-CoA lyase
MTQIEIVEVSPRDGLQNEAVPFSTEQKIELITRAIDAGFKRIEAVSFVNPKRVPQMADGEAVMAGVPRDRGVHYVGLALNRRGFDRALAAGCDEINFVAVTTEAFSQRNQGASVEHNLAVWSEIASEARAAGVPATLSISAAFGCPYEGEVPRERVVEIAQRGAEAGPTEIIIADTIGCAVPTDVTALIQAVKAALPDVGLRCHFHNTRNTGLANAAAAVTAGVTGLDASIGGIGGCPFAPGATGNIPTEDLVYMLHRMGFDTGLDLKALVDVGRWLEKPLGRAVPAAMARAGVFPRAA